MRINEVKLLLSERGWSVSALSQRWGFSRRYVTERLAQGEIGEHWSDALRGLPLGPGKYRERGLRVQVPRGVCLDAAALRGSLRIRQWTVVAVADRWEFGRRHITDIIADAARGPVWNDAFAGLPIGPGLYRRGSVAESTVEGGLGVGSLVASEADMYNFDYGARGVVVDMPKKGSYLVVWDGGALMEIDDACLEDWVVDLGLVVREKEALHKLGVVQRVELARQLDLNGC